MAQLGLRTVNEMVGRVDLLDGRKAIEHWKARGLDFAALLHKPTVPAGVATYCREAQDHGLDGRPRPQAHRAEQIAPSKSCKPVRIELEIHNSNRTVGAMLSYEVAKRYGEDGLPDGTIQIEFHGSAGQSFGAFLAKGITLHVDGDANDYFCKGLSGGTVAIIRPPTPTQTSSRRRTSSSVTSCSTAPRPARPSSAVSRASASRCATAAPRPSSKVSATTAAST